MSVFLNNLDDYISPSQACVNPIVLNQKSQASPTLSDPASKRIQLQTDLSSVDFGSVASKPNLIKSVKSQGSSKVASVSLSDCLACSGCVTSAETVLIEEQSSSKLLDELSIGLSLIVVAISPQTLISLSANTSIPPKQLFLLLASFLKKLGVYYVVDASSCGDVSLIESKNEFLDRLAAGPVPSPLIPPPPTRAISSSVSEPVILAGSNPSPLPSSSHLSLHTPMLTSSCPGWVCFAEKTHPETIPLLSRSRSAQQILGALVKSILQPWVGGPGKDSSSEGSEGEQNLDKRQIETYQRVFVVSIQPCFDKKLEATRKDFFHSEGLNRLEGETGEGDSEVDLVLSTGEMWKLLETCLPAQGESPPSSLSPDGLLTSLTAFVSEPDHPGGRDGLEALFRSFSPLGEELVRSVDSAGSGGYLEYVVRSAAHSLWGEEVGEESWWTRPLPAFKGLDSDKGRSALSRARSTVSTIVNPDLMELEISRPEGWSDRGSSDSLGMKVDRIRFLRCYGFRSIQSLVRRLRRQGTLSSEGPEQGTTVTPQTNWDFVEVMACPSGCLNGGGQLRLQPIGGESGSSFSETPSQSKQRLASLERTLKDETSLRLPHTSPLVQFLYSSSPLVPGLEDPSLPMLLAFRTKLHSLHPDHPQSLPSLMHTSFHSVPKLEALAPLATKW